MNFVTCSFGLSGFSIYTRFGNNPNQQVLSGFSIYPTFGDKLNAGSLLPAQKCECGRAEHAEKKHSVEICACHIIPDLGITQTSKFYQALVFIPLYFLPIYLPALLRTQLPAVAQKQFYCFVWPCEADFPLIDDLLAQSLFSKCAESSRTFRGTRST